MASTCITNQRIFSCKFSPVKYDLIACTTFNKCPNGDSGGLHIFCIRNRTLEPYLTGIWTEALLDCTWHGSGRLLTTGSADGSLQTWSVAEEVEDTKFVPVALIPHGHRGAITSVIPCSISTSILSGAIDNQVKQWGNSGSLIGSCQMSDAVIQIAASSFQQVYAVTADLMLKCLDFRNTLMNPIVITDRVQSCDISFHDPNLLLIGCSTGDVAVHDIRMPIRPISRVKSHQGGIRRVRASKFFPFLGITAGFDGHTVITDLSSGTVLERVVHHSDIVYDVDSSKHDPFLVADCSWDSLLHTFHPRSLRSLLHVQRMKL